jgi:hypothetical protein
MTDNQLTTYNIYPPVKKYLSMNSISVFVYDIVLFQSVKVICTLYDIDNKEQDTRKYYLTGDDYTNWTDDNYIINYCKRKLQEEA